MMKKNLCEWFDVSNIDHLKAYRHLEQHGSWPEGFIPENVNRNHMSTIVILGKLAGAYLDLKVEKP